MIAAIYARKSTEQRGADEEQKSVARQVANATAFAAARGWTVDAAHIYIDDGISGAESRRLLAKQRLLDLARSGRCPFGVVVMQAQDRLSRRAGDEAFGELKMLAKQCEVWFYADGRRFEHGTFASNTVGFLHGEVAAEFRRAIAAKTYEAMRKRAEQGYVTGGVLFGYDNVRVNGHVERRINAAEAAVIRDIFKRAAAGEGGRTIAKALNAAGTVAPRGRTWSPGSVRDLLHRTTYAGVVTWNQSKKRDAEGEQRQRDRPKADWLTVPAEPLRIVDEPTWQAVRARLHGKRASANDAPPTIVGRGIRQRYLLAGFGRCTSCGGSMMVVSRASSGGRKARYCCSGYWNRGTTVCANGMMTELPTTDQAVRDLLTSEVLRPQVVARAIDLTLTAWQRQTRDGSHVTRLQTQLAALDRELTNLAETAARGGAVPAVLTLLGQREEQRRSVAADLDRAQRVRAVPTLNTQTLRTRVRGFLSDWQDVLRDPDTIEARGVLDRVLVDRIRFTPDVDQHRYQLTVPIGFDRILTAAVPEFAGFTRNDGVPKGIRHSLPAGFPRNVAI